MMWQCCMYFHSGKRLWTSRQSIAIRKWTPMGHVWPPTHQSGRRSVTNWRWKLPNAHHHSKACVFNTYHPQIAHLFDVSYLFHTFFTLAQWSRRSDKTVPSSLWSSRSVWGKTRARLPPVQHTSLVFSAVLRRWISVEWVSQLKKKRNGKLLKARKGLKVQAE